MSGLDAVWVLLGGVVAGALNAVVGAGTLVTFPLLVALGVPPITANVSNTVGLVPASVSAAYGFRRELAGRWRTVASMAALSVAGGVAGGLLLLASSEETFTAVVPALLLLAALLAAVQPRVAAAVRRRAVEGSAEAGAVRPLTGGLMAGLLVTGVYGGYFGAAQSVILLALLGALWATDLRIANGAKNVLTGATNLVSALVFIAGGEVDWRVAGLIAAGSAVGGAVGARIGRRLPAAVLRAGMVGVAVVAAVLIWLA